MQESINEKISLLVDDQLACPEAMALLKTMTSDQHLKAKLQRYQLIGQVLKNEPCYLLDSHFADLIHQQLRQEPIHFLPAQKPVSHWRKTGLAVAASAVLAVVLLNGNQQLAFAPHESSPTVTAQIAQPQQPASQAQIQLTATAPAEPVAAGPAQPQLAANSEPAPKPPKSDNARFKEYLQAHDNSVYINQSQGFQPYATVVGYHQE